MPPCGYAMMWMFAWDYAMMWMSIWCKHNLFKNSFYFQNEASTTPEIKIFSKLDLLKSYLPFDLRLPKKLVITIRKSLNGALTWNLMIWLKRFIFTIWLSKKGQCSSKAFFLKKMNSLKIKHLKKIHFCCSWIWQFDKRQDPPWQVREFERRYSGTKGSNFWFWKG